MMASHAPDTTVEVPLSALIGLVVRLPRPILTHFVEQAIERLDNEDGDPDAEADGDELDGSSEEEDVPTFLGNSWAQIGCPVADPPEDEGHDEEQTWSHPDDHPAELFIGVRR